MTGQPIMPQGCGLAVFEDIDSTNSEALRRNPGEAPLWVWARAQNAGRGRQGRAWASARGNLYASHLLRVEFDRAFTPQLSFVAALAVHDAISELGAARGREARFSGLRLKWPNDVLLDGAKIAGILLESSSAGSPPEALAIGCGINLAHHPELDERRATSLAAHGVRVDAGEALGVLAGAMQRRLGEWDAGSGFAGVRRDWLARAMGLGEAVEVRLPNENLTGVFRDIDSDGALILGLADGREQRITAGDVFTLNREET